MLTANRVLIIILAAAINTVATTCTIEPDHLLPSVTRAFADSTDLHQYRSTYDSGTPYNERNPDYRMPPSSSQSYVPSGPNPSYRRDDDARSRSSAGSRPGPSGGGEQSTVPFSVFGPDGNMQTCQYSNATRHVSCY